MNFKTPPLILLTALLLISKSVYLQTDFQERVNSTCNNLSFPSFNLSTEEIEDKRNSSDHDLKYDPEYFTLYLQDDDLGKKIESLVLYFTLLLILGVACVIATVLFIVYCYLESYSGASEGRSKTVFLLSIVFFIILTAFLVTSIVYMAKTDKDLDEIRCVFNQLSNNIINGETDFIGLNKSKQLLLAFREEVDNLSTAELRFKSIQEKNLEADAKAATNGLQQFSIRFEDRTINDGNGNNSTPNTVKELTSHVSDPIYNEFIGFEEVGIAIENSAIVGTNIVQFSSERSYQDSIDVAVANLDTKTSILETELGQLVDSTDSFTSNTRTQIILIGVCMGIIFLLSIVMLFLFGPNIRSGVMEKEKVVKAGLLVLSIFTVCLSILSCFLLFQSADISTYCEVIKDTLVNGSSSALSEYGIITDQSLLDSVDICLNTEKTTKLASFAGISGGDESRINDIQILTNGLHMYNLAEPSLNSEVRGSVEVESKVNTWKQYQEGLLIDQDAVGPNLSELNGLVSCGSISFGLNEQSCNTSDCTLLISAAVSQIPSCTSDNERATFLLNNLIEYANQDRILVSEMIQALSSENQDSPNKRLIAHKNELKSIESSTETIENQLVKTLSIVNGSTLSLDKQLDCAFIRNKLKEVEIISCFEFNRNLYLFFVMVSVSVFCSFIFNLLLCISVRCLPGYKNRSSGLKGGEEDNLHLTDHQIIPI